LQPASRRRLGFRFAAPWVVGLSFAALGCIGDIGDRDTLGPGDEGPGYGVTEGDPGRVTLHRLNRVEYNNTVRDLLGTEQQPADDFPNDDHSYGFDNIADVLTISPLQLELYERAAESLAEEALSLSQAAMIVKTEAETLTGTQGQVSGDAWNLYSSGEVGGSWEFPAAGDYVVRARVWGQQAGPDPVQMSFHVGAQSFGPYDVTATSSNPVVIEETVTVAGAGSQQVAVEFLNDYYDPDTSADRNLLVDWIEVEGPLGAVGGNAIFDAIVTCDPVPGGEACVRQIIGDFAERAWRRPVADTEIDPLLGLVQLAETEGDDVMEGLKLAMRGILTSPHFLFRVEIDPEPASPVPHPLGDFEVASRLSYFLWSSMPDEVLFDAARSGKLQDPAEITSQVARMLADDKAAAVVENFAGQWLFTRALADASPDYAAFPEFDDDLRAAMKAESDLFFREFLEGDVGIDSLLSTDFTYVNDRLAEHYGMPLPGSGVMTRVSLSDDQRGGLLKQAGLLTVTSYPARTSPVKRGKWVLTQLLCSEPPPPPPGVEGLKTEDLEGASLRQKLEAHRADPVCASCHQLMDPIGFGLENYDGIGAFRTDDNGFDIDASGTLPDGTEFNGANELAKLISTDPRFAKCATQKTFVYALGRGVSSDDKDYLQGISEQFAAGGYKLKDLLALIAASEPFRFRRGQPEEGGQP
jgi:hypothetical protein